MADPIPPRVLIIACGALARELLAIIEINGLNNVTIECLPASLHNRPSEIPDLVRQRIRRARGLAPATGAIAASRNLLVDGAVDESGDDALLDTEVRLSEDASAQLLFDDIFVGYADCGTGGRLADVCRDEGVTMIEGAHCYQFFAGHDGFERLQDHALGSFYLTDFLARNWERLIWHGLGIAAHPELRDMYFGNYTRLVYLEQADDPKARQSAHEAAERLGLELHIEPTGYGELETAVVDFTTKARS